MGQLVLPNPSGLVSRRHDHLVRGKDYMAKRAVNLPNGAAQAQAMGGRRAACLPDHLTVGKASNGKPGDGQIIVTPGR